MPQTFSTGQEEVLNGNFVLDHSTSAFKFVFDDPSIEPWNELYVTDINQHFGINYHCRGDESMFRIFLSNSTVPNIHFENFQCTPTPTQDNARLPKKSSMK